MSESSEDHPPWSEPSGAFLSLKLRRVIAMAKMINATIKKRIRNSICFTPSYYLAIMIAIVALLRSRKNSAPDSFSRSHIFVFQVPPHGLIAPNPNHFKIRIQVHYVAIG